MNGSWNTRGPATVTGWWIGIEVKDQTSLIHLRRKVGPKGIAQQEKKTLDPEKKKKKTGELLQELHRIKEPKLRELFQENVVQEILSSTISPNKQTGHILG